MYKYILSVTRQNGRLKLQFNVIVTSVCVVYVWTLYLTFPPVIGDSRRVSHLCKPSDRAQTVQKQASSIARDRYRFIVIPQASKWQRLCKVPSLSVFFGRFVVPRSSVSCLAVWTEGALKTVQLFTQLRLQTQHNTHTATSWYTVQNVCHFDVKRCTKTARETNKMCLRTVRYHIAYTETRLDLDTINIKEIQNHFIYSKHLYYIQHVFL